MGSVVHTSTCEDLKDDKHMIIISETTYKPGVTFQRKIAFKSTHWLTMCSWYIYVHVCKNAYDKGGNTGSYIN